MKKPNNNKRCDITAFIYPRLSRDDNLEGGSYSISNHNVIYKGRFPPRIIS